MRTGFKYALWIAGGYLAYKALQEGGENGLPDLGRILTGAVGALGVAVGGGSATGRALQRALNTLAEAWQQAAGDYQVIDRLAPSSILIGSGMKPYIEQARASGAFPAQRPRRMFEELEVDGIVGPLTKGTFRTMQEGFLSMDAGSEFSGLGLSAIYDTDPEGPTAAMLSITERILAALEPIAAYPAYNSAAWQWNLWLRMGDTYMANL